ncbi:hypothetical protein [Dyella subtropica]|uniref:hypothetical protein n=1 Tax=Dyella subtropica TaxID=2992127 RepID=UPI002250F8D0|nr:hypothetical protein [Dyella subtropica]
MTDEFIEPTPQGRRSLIVLLVIGVVLAISYRFWLQPALLGYIHSLPLCDQLPWWRGLLISVLVSFLFVAFLSTWNALQLLRHGQSPPPGTWVFQRTKIQRGVAVRRRAYFLLAIAALAVLIAWYCWQNISTTPIFHPRGECASHQALPSTKAPSVRSD